MIRLFKLLLQSTWLTTISRISSDGHQPQMVNAQLKMSIGILATSRPSNYLNKVLEASTPKLIRSYKELGKPKNYHL
jgi:hypothetical protein